MNLGEIPFFRGKIYGCFESVSRRHIWIQLKNQTHFMTIFTHQGSGKSRAAFASPYPGKIIPVNLAMHGGALICQKDAFLCAAKGVQVSIAFQKRVGTALFGGEGFIMQKLEGDGMAFLHAGGTVVKRALTGGQNLRVDTGCIVALEPSVKYDIQFVGGVKSAIFGGEGFFFASLTGPGKVWLQSLPFSRLAGRIHQAAPQTGGGGKGEGSVLGSLGGIGGMTRADESVNYVTLDVGSGLYSFKLTGTRKVPGKAD